MFSRDSREEVTRRSEGGGSEAGAVCSWKSGDVLNLLDRSSIGFGGERPLWPDSGAFFAVLG